MEKSQPLKIDWDELQDQVTIEGTIYSGALLRAWGKDGFPEGTLFKIVKRENGALTIQNMKDIRIKLGPLELACKACGTKDTFTLDMEHPLSQKEPVHEK